MLTIVLTSANYRYIDHGEPVETAAPAPALAATAPRAVPEVWESPEWRGGGSARDVADSGETRPGLQLGPPSPAHDREAHTLISTLIASYCSAIECMQTVEWRV